MHRFPIYGIERLQAQQCNDIIKDKCCEEKQIKIIRLNTDLFNKNNDYIRVTLSEAIRNINNCSIERATTNE